MGLGDTPWDRVNDRVFIDQSVKPTNWLDSRGWALIEWLGTSIECIASGRVECTMPPKWGKTYLFIQISKSVELIIVH